MDLVVTGQGYSSDIITTFILTTDHLVGLSDSCLPVEMYRFHKRRVLEAFLKKFGNILIAIRNVLNMHFDVGKLSQLVMTE